MAPQPEAAARQEIDLLLTQAGWAVQCMAEANLHAALGVAIREFPLNPGHGFADYLLYVDSKACGEVEAERQGTPLRGVELQSARYAQGLPATLPAWTRPDQPLDARGPGRVRAPVQPDLPPRPSAHLERGAA